MEKNQILKTKFLSLSNWEEIMDLFEHYFNEYKQEKKNPINKKALANLLFRKESFKYKSYTIKKKNGEERLIHAPIPDLKLIQQVLNECIQLCFTPRNAAHGFIKERSIVTNAKMHVKRNFVYNIDLENFFPSIHFGRVIGVFKSHPFNFNGDLARIMANLCCFRHVLPQGAPTSPVISNLVCRRLDRHLSSFAKKHRVRYSRYADDITFSSNIHVFTEQFKTELELIINQENFKVNRAKERLQTQTERQTVTGIIVNQKLNVTKKYKGDIRFLIKLLEKEKKDDPPKLTAQAWLDANYKNRQRYFGKVPKIEEVIRGKLDFMKMVVGEERLEQFVYFNRAKELGIFDNGKLNAENDTIDISIAEKNKRRQEEWFEKAKDYFVNNKELLISEIDFTHVNSLKESLDEVLLNETNVIENLKYRKQKISHNPSKLTKYLYKFRSTSKSPFGKLIHRNNENYGNIIKQSKQELEKLRDKVKSDKIPYEIFKSIEIFINKLNSDKKRATHSEGTISDAFDKIYPLIFSFNKSYRFGLSNDEVKIKELILSIIKENKTELKRYKYLHFSKNIDNEFDVQSSTRNIESAIRHIFSLCQERSNGYGAFSILHVKKANREILKIVDVGSYSEKRLSKIKVGGGGFERLKALLWAYCDLNIYLIKGEENIRIPLLPEGREIESVEEKIDGFTYELVFHNPFKVLVIDDAFEDDGRERIKKCELLIEEHPDLAYVIEYSNRMTQSHDMDEFNAIFIHKSYSGHGYKKIKNKRLEYDFKIISFSGGKSNFYEPSQPNHLTLSVYDFYRLLPQILKNADENQSIDLEAIYSISTKTNYGKGSIKEIMDQIEDEKLEFPKLSEEVIEKIKNVSKQNNVSDFNNRKQLYHFLKHF